MSLYFYRKFFKEEEEEEQICTGHGGPGSKLYAKLLRSTES